MIIYIWSLDYSTCTGILCIPDSKDFDFLKLTVALCGEAIISLESVTVKNCSEQVIDCKGVICITGLDRASDKFVFTWERDNISIPVSLNPSIL